MEQRWSAKNMNANQFISWLEGTLDAQEKETKLSKAIRSKLKQVSRDEWVQPYFRRELPLVTRKDWNTEGPTCGAGAVKFK